MCIVFVNGKLAEIAPMNLLSLFGIAIKNHHLYSCARISMLTRAHGYKCFFFRLKTIDTQSVILGKVSAHFQTKFQKVNCPIQICEKPSLFTFTA